MLEKVLDSALRKGIAHGNLRLVYPSGRGETYGDGSGPPIAIRITDRSHMRAIALDPGLAVAESYMDGALVVDHGDIYDLIAIAKSNMRPEVSTPGAWFQHLRRSVTLAPLAHAVGLKAARANVAHHYDLDGRLYRLFLDGDMQYSCAWFERPDMTLDQAQLAKKRLVASKLLVRPGARVLDIGCGWGGMALYLARCCDAEVTGITLSQEQLRVAEARAEAAGLADRVHFRLQDYREISETFDNIVSVGMFEHVGKRQFPVFFQSAARLLAPDGVMVLHSMTQPSPALYNQPFIEKYIFPGGYIPAVSEVVPSIENSGLLLRDLEILSVHYAETLRAWRERFLTRRDEVLELYDERFIRMWEFYLAGSESAFRHDHLHVSHFQLAHDQERVPLTRAYIAEAQARLVEREKLVPDYARLHDKARPELAPLRRDAS
ncbi:cyclopropane-fatty-acyl-phospholipid synthase [Amaricoccus macauensis]|uniref:Cyclopropane-fatty-acyl-phospholipid synthase n=1 Tax=Amaricoccus macauensis TaxID=57001 RepID=A0A840SIT3_9RHOB|nr:cyclopropane-fatty-acyl-phospholipid synthase family protein [Amaricoccus macauensis]MBB5221777.1 cyclopropane-fatty-acyl-phospholipid synthase [Amaricoccus macauensis]